MSPVGIVVAGGDDLGLLADLHLEVGDFLGPLVHQEHHHHHLGMVGEHRLGDLLEQHGLAGAGRGHDQAALPSTDRRDHVQRAHGELVPGELELELLVRMDRGEAFEDRRGVSPGGSGAGRHRTTRPLALSRLRPWPCPDPCPCPCPCGGRFPEWRRWRDRLLKWDAHWRKPFPSPTLEVNRHAGHSAPRCGGTRGGPRSGGPMTGPKCTGTRSPPPENRGPAASGCSYRVVRSRTLVGRPRIGAHPSDRVGACVARARGTWLAPFPRHVLAMAVGLHRRDPRLRRGPGARGRAAARPAPPAPGLRGHHPGVRRPALAHALGPDLWPGVRGDLLRRRRRHPERRRAAGPAPPDPVRADPDRLRQSLRRRLRPSVLGPRGGPPAGRGRGPAGGRGRGGRRALPVPPELRLPRPGPGGGGGRASPAARSRPAAARLLPHRGPARSGTRRWPRSASRWTARWPRTRPCWSRWPTWRPTATS